MTREGRIMILLLLVFPVASLAMPVSQEYNHSVFMDPDEKYQLHWSIRGDRIHMAVQVNTTGWIGLGIAKGLAGKMKDADIVIGYVVNDQGYLTDRHATGNTRPVIDGSQDYVMESAEETNGQTIIKMNRKLETCDGNDLPIKLGTQRLIYAYNDEDPTPEMEATIEYHQDKGSKSMNLREFISNDPTPSGTQFMDLLNDNVTVPAKATSYWCTVHKLPDLGGKKHVIEISPVIQSGHLSLIHHILIYGCNSNFDEAHLNASDECYTGNMPPPVKECTGMSTVFAWAIGSKTFRFPKHVGMPIGVAGASNYYVMEVHFDNPRQRSDLVDSSGLRLHYTDQPRQYDGGLFSVGLSVGEHLLIPPEQKEWASTGYCEPVCSQKLASPTALNGNSVNIFAALPHAHLAGRAISASLIRNETEVAKIVTDESYDFNFQQMLLLKEEVEMKAGDSIISVCKYNTEGQQRAVWGGLGTTNEMCLIFLMYYPLQNLTSCKTEDRLYYTQFQPVYKPPGGWSSAVWNETMIQDLKKLYASEKTYVNCKAAEGVHHEDVDDLFVAKTIIKNPLTVPTSPCDQIGSNAKMVTSLKQMVFALAMLALASTVLDIF